MHIHVVCTRNYIPCKDVSTKDTPYNVAKVRDIVDIRKGTGYQDVTLPSHGKAGDQNEGSSTYRCAHNLIKQNQILHLSHWMFLLQRNGGNNWTSVESLSCCTQFRITELYIFCICDGLQENRGTSITSHSSLPHTNQCTIHAHMRAYTLHVPVQPQHVYIHSCTHIHIYAQSELAFIFILAVS